MENKEVFSLDLGANSDSSTAFIHSLRFAKDFKRRGDYWNNLKIIWNDYGLPTGHLVENALPDSEEVKYDTRINGIVQREKLPEIHMRAWNFFRDIAIGNRACTTTHRLIEWPIPESYSIKPTRNIIAKMGVELEGAWKQEPFGRKGDGSVQVPYTDQEGRHVTGEIAMPPFAPDEFPWEKEVLFPSYDHFESGVKSSFLKLYPDKINHTCGMHVHYSFLSLGIYSVFVDKRFPGWLNLGLRRWGEIAGVKSKTFWSRLEGNNIYCKNKYVPENILSRGDRYTAVNYCWRAHQTIEIRVLPMFKDARWAIKAIKALTRLINLWGCVMGPKEGESFRLITTICEFN